MLAGLFSFLWAFLPLLPSAPQNPAGYSIVQHSISSGGIFSFPLFFAEFRNLPALDCCFALSLAATTTKCGELWQGCISISAFPLSPVNTGTTMALTSLTSPRDCTGHGLSTSTSAQNSNNNIKKKK